MSLIEDLKRKWEEMDEIDRKNFWIGVIGFILIIVVIMQLNSTIGGLGSILGSGAGYVNESVSGMKELGGMR